MAQQSQSFWFTKKGLAALGLIAAASYFLLVEHRQLLFEFLPYLILLLCPLMHIFMHRGHGGQGAQGDREPQSINKESPSRMPIKNKGRPTVKNKY